jgi:hypothetical protein
MKVLLLSLTLILLVDLNTYSYPRTQQRQKEDPSTKEGLQVSLITSKFKVKRGEKITLHVMLSNIMSDEHIYVLSSFGWGHNASLLLHVRDATGREIEPQGFPDDKLFVDLNDASTFVKLPPQQFVGRTLVSELEFLNVKKPGKYSIYVEYFCKVRSPEVKQKPFWGYENGTIFSNLVWIEVLP